MGTVHQLRPNQQPFLESSEVADAICDLAVEKIMEVETERDRLSTENAMFRVMIWNRDLWLFGLAMATLGMAVFTTAVLLK